MWRAPISASITESLYWCGLRLFCLICFTIFPCLTPVKAQSSAADVTGMWKATVGNGPMIEGMWLAQVSKGGPRSASGSWSLLNDSGEVVLQGTWSARKTDQKWEGSWRARAGNGRSLSGTWTAAVGDFKGQTMEEMLAWTMHKQIGGAWQSGRYSGNWWLEGARKKRL